MNEYNIFQGSEAYIGCATLSSTFIMSDGYHKFSSDDIVQADDGLKIRLDSSLTSGFYPGPYTYQVVNPTGLEKQGKLKVKANLLYADDVASYWRQVLQAIDEKLKGRATDATNSVHVGDKSIAYMSLDELIKLRAFALQRLSEDEEEEVSSPNDEKDILYVWRLR